MNFHLLNYFVVVAETGSFTQASERLFITQPSLSVGIKKLENKLGVKLFERRKKHIILTAAGQYFLDKAKDILNQFEAAQIELLQNDYNHNTLRLGILQTLPLASITRLISNFGKVYPDIAIEQLSGNLVELEQSLERGEIDLVISILRDRQDRRTSQIFFQENYSVAVAENHPLVQKKSLSFSALDGVRYIDRTKSEIRDELQKLFVEKMIRPQVTYRAAHDELSNALVAAGMGIAVMPDQSKIPGIVKLPFSDVNLMRQVGLVWRTEQNSNAVSRFQEFSTSYFAEYSLASV